ncbi:hypothetical protein TI05_17295, partial [Achromatium sp. WMS3]
VEKHYGYNYEHVFSYNWNAMRGFHYLMRMGHMFNAIALHTKRVIKIAKTLGKQSFLKFVHETCAHPWLSIEWCHKFANLPFQLRLE